MRVDELGRDAWARGVAQARADRALAVVELEELLPTLDPIRDAGKIAQGRALLERYREVE